ncbi:unnamed protein product [Arctogadus glacialis]
MLWLLREKSENLSCPGPIKNHRGETDSETGSRAAVECLSLSVSLSQPTCARREKRNKEVTSEPCWEAGPQAMRERHRNPPPPPPCLYHHQHRHHQYAGRVGQVTAGVRSNSSSGEP